MSVSRKICAVIPVKDTAQAKQRLAALLPAARRRELALAMFEDVIAAVSSVRELAGIVVVTIDAGAAAIAARHNARVMSEGACEGHTGAVMTAARRLAADGLDLLTLPGDIPLVEPKRRPAPRPPPLCRRRSPGGCLHHRTSAGRAWLQRRAVLAGQRSAAALRRQQLLPAPGRGQNAWHRARVVHLPRIGLDIDTPDDLALFLQTPSQTRAYALLQRLAHSPRRRGTANNHGMSRRHGTLV